MAQYVPTPFSSLRTSTAPVGATSTCRRARHAPARFVQRRRGVALIYTALGLATFMGVTAMVVDMGRLYTRRAQAQNAADAAALAGAFELYNGATKAEETAKEYAKRNGYGAGAKITVRTFTATPDSTILDSIRVSVERPEDLYFLPAFAALLGQSASSSRVGASATSKATFSTDPINTPISLGAEYGATNGFANPSVFGQDARYSYGDAYSPLFLNDGKTPNVGTDKDPRGADFKGYEYTLKIGADYASRNGTSQVQMEIFDPDCYVQDTSNMLKSWDEYHVDTNGSVVPTETTYTLLAPKASKDDPDVVVAQATYGNDATTDLKWVTPSGFNFDSSKHGPGNDTLRVKGGRGTSENGFQLRAGSPHVGLNTADDYAVWKEKYNFGGAGNGTSFSSRGKAVFNFTTNAQNASTATVNLNLGLVPKNATQVLVDKFDTDVGFQSIKYSIFKADAAGNPTNEQIPATLPNGQQAKDGQWATTDVMNVPANYKELAPNGAFWFASYEASAYDTSNWIMGFTDPKTPPTEPGSVKLVD